MSEAMGPQERLAREIAIEAHGSTINPKTGEVYINHPEHVAAQVKGDEAKAVAWLHDVVEDTDVTSSGRALFRLRAPCCGKPACTCGQGG